ncbi:MAG TPA: hypothetical protein VFA46_06325 [Actinomycetes bacterium]|jgi:hypothetical protein|nr:hypothetical protein [Actinomycetes bacterium]
MDDEQSTDIVQQALAALDAVALDAYPVWAPAADVDERIAQAVQGR